SSPFARLFFDGTALNQSVRPAWSPPPVNGPNDQRQEHLPALPSVDDHDEERLQRQEAALRKQVLIIQQARLAAIRKAEQEALENPRPYYLNRQGYLTPTLHSDWFLPASSSSIVADLPGDESNPSRTAQEANPSSSSSSNSIYAYTTDGEHSADQQTRAIDSSGSIYAYTTDGESEEDEKKSEMGSVRIYAYATQTESERDKKKPQMNSSSSSIYAYTTDGESDPDQEREKTQPAAPSILPVTLPHQFSSSPPQLTRDDQAPSLHTGHRSAQLPSRRPLSPPFTRATTPSSSSIASFSSPTLEIPGDSISSVSTYRKDDEHLTWKGWPARPRRLHFRPG
ncbi:hypothetical protein OC845_006753, partial [Tilletia horrida]